MLKKWYCQTGRIDASGKQQIIISCEGLSSTVVDLHVHRTAEKKACVTPTSKGETSQYIANKEWVTYKELAL